MKNKLITVVILVLCLLFIGCDTSNKAGKCVGYLNQNEKKPELEYEISMDNAIISALTVELIIPPILWFAYMTECPVVKK